MTPNAVTSIDELVALFPYGLGFHPEDCLAFLSTRRSLALMWARIPLHHPESGMPLATPDLAVMVSHVVTAAAAAGADGLYAVVFERERGVGAPLLDLVGAACAQVRLRVRDVAVVHGRTRWSPWSPDDREAVEGVPLVDASASPAVIGCLLAGSAPFAGRDEVAALVRCDAAQADGVAQALTRRQTLVGCGRRAPRAGRLWRRVVGSAAGTDVVTALTVDEVAALLLSLADRDWRDAVLAGIWPGAPDLVGLPAGLQHTARRWLRPSEVAPGRVLLDRFLALARRTPPEAPAAVAAICSVVGHVAWSLGQGAIARDAYERALQADPTYRLAQLGFHIVARGVRPERGPAAGHLLGSAAAKAV